MEESFTRPRNEPGKLDQVKLNIAQEKAEKILSSPEFARISPDLFQNYDQRQVQEDKDLVDSLKEKWNVDNEDPRVLQEGKIDEGFIFDMIGNTKWFGDASIRRTSEFDDYTNNIDAIVGLHAPHPSIPNTSYLGLGLDATTSRSGISRKLTGIATRARKRTLGTIKYAEIDNFKGEMSHVPETVLYIDRRSFSDVVGRWIVPRKQKMPGNNAPGDESMQRSIELSSHPLQLEFLAQIYVQLDTFSKLTAGNDRDRLKITSKIIFQRIQERSELLKLGKESLSKILQSESVNQIRDAVNQIK